MNEDHGFLYRLYLAVTALLKLIFLFKRLFFFLYVIMGLEGCETVEFFIPDGSMYIAFVLLTTFFLCMASQFAATQTVHKQAALRQGSLCIVQQTDVCSNCNLVPSIYFKYKMTCSVHRQESAGEQDDEGPYLSMFFA
ncbi:hypothetical protein ACFFMS_25790 [Ectobacillus funiculus]|uniref:Uncharacterized protein n=1 Tax=Ectobacillus funiculus TaxID=137993 RepID=A0ABV5WMI3_9BACI